MAEQHNNAGNIVYLLKPQKQMNSKLPAIILAAALLGSCGGLRSTKQSAAAQDSDAIYYGDTDSINIEDSDATNEEESARSERQWKNPEYYVFDKPSDDSIAVWKAACEEYDSVPENIVVPTDKFSKSPAYLAFCDWLHVCHSNNEILLWRLNELMPAESSFDGEVQRYRYFCLQIDSLESCLPELGPQQEMNDGAYMCADLADLTAQIYSSRLRQALPSLCSVLEQEEAPTVLSIKLHKILLTSAQCRLIRYITALHQHWPMPNLQKTLQSTDIRPSSRFTCS